MPEISKAPVTAADIQLLKDSVENLANRLEETKTEQGRQKRNTRWLAASVILDIILSFAIAIGGYIIDRNQSEISEIQKAQHIETELNRSNQCTLTNLLLRFEGTSTTSPTISEEEKNKRKASYADLHAIHANLRCDVK